MATTNLGKVVGDSAYEVAVSQGYVGTESEWLASLHGANGEDGAPGEDGFSPSAEVVKTGSVATITITDKDGTTTASIYDGANGTNGTDGADGFSPIANVVKTGSVATITITDSIGTTTASVYDGSVATLSAGTGIDITGDTISNIAPYSDTAVASFISTKFGMANNSTGQYLQNSVITDTTGGTASLTWYYPIEIRPDLEVYTRESGLINPALVGTIATNDWTVNDDTITASLTSTDGQYSFEVYNSTAWTITYPPSSHFDLVLRFYAGTYSVVPLQADFLPIDDSTIKVNGSGNIYAVAPTFTESDPIFAASAAASITASDISNWNSIVGVPTYSVADDGKVLAITSSGTALGWEAVSGGGCEWMVANINLSNYTGNNIKGQLTEEQTKNICDMYYSPSTAKPMIIHDTATGCNYILTGNTGSSNTFRFWEPNSNKYIEAIVTSTTSLGNVSGPNALSFNSPINANYIKLSGWENPVGTNSMLLSNALNGIKTNWPTPDGTTITASGNVWSAVGGGSALTVSGGNGIVVSTVSDVATVSLDSPITLTSSEGAYCLIIEHDDGEHSTGMNGDDIVMVGTAIPEGEEDPYDKWVNQISDDYISLQYHDWDDNEGNERLVSEVSINSEDASITVAEYDIDGNNEEYNPYQTWMNTSGFSFYINDGNGTEHLCKLYIDIDGSLLYEIDNDGAPHKLYDNSNPL